MHLRHYNLGRRPARHNLRTMRSAIVLDRHLGALGPPPAASADYLTPLLTALKASGAVLGMYLNDSLGDCVCADTAHQVLLHTANAGALVIPTNDQVLALYEAVGGYRPGDSSTDQGCDETSMCEYLMTTGFCDQRSAGSGMIDPRELDLIRWGIQLFGGVRVGIVVDQQMESQFESGHPWDTAAGADDPNAGGHDVYVFGYNADGFQAFTWGGTVTITPQLMAQEAFLEEAHAEVWPDFIAATGSAPNGLNLQQLLNDLPVVTGEIP